MKLKVVFIALVVACLMIFSLFLFKSNHDDKIHIKFSSWGSKSEIEVIKKIIKLYEDNNENVKIDFIHIPQNYFQKMQMLFASGLEPDIVFINNQNIQMYINANLLEDLTPYFNNTELNLYYSEALDCFKKDGILYAIPRDISNLVIYYNKDIFKRQKVNLPEKIKDIFELKQIAKKVTTKDNFGINFEENSLYWGYFLASNGGGIISDDKKEIIINSPKSIEALNLYADMINKDYSVPKKSDMGSLTSAQMFINGKIAMYLSGRWMTPKFRETITFDWDVTEFPSPNKVYIDSSGWAVSKKSKHKKEAVELIKYLSSSEAGFEFAKSGLIVPANNKVNFNSNADEKPLNSVIFQSMLKNAKPTPVTENYAAINDLINEKVENIFNAAQSADAVFDTKTVNKLEKLLHD